MLFIGLYYVKDSGKRAKCRYNHQTGFRRKMLQYKTSTKDDVAIQFYQTTTTGPKQFQYATTPELAVKKTMATKCTETTSNEVSVNTPTCVEVAGPSSSEITTPSKKRVVLQKTNNCQKC